jgi:hypothetical protein
MAIRSAAMNNFTNNFMTNPAFNARVNVQGNQVPVTLEMLQGSGHPAGYFPGYDNSLNASYMNQNMATRGKDEPREDVLMDHVLG